MAIQSSDTDTDLRSSEIDTRYRSLSFRHALPALRPSTFALERVKVPVRRRSTSLAHYRLVRGMEDDLVVVGHIHILDKPVFLFQTKVELFLR